MSTASKDYLNAPTVNVISAHEHKGQAENMISVNASDDFEVKSVIVAIYDVTGALLETSTPSQRKCTAYELVKTSVNQWITPKNA